MHPSTSNLADLRFLISVLTYRKDSGVERCLDSIHHGGGYFTLHLTDNGGDVGEFFEHWCEREGRVAVIAHHEKNLGFIGGNEVAFEYAKKHGFTHLVFVNDDAEVPPGWLERIAAEFRRHPAAAVVGAKGGCRTLNHDWHGHHGESLDYVEFSCAAVSVDVVARHFSSLFPKYLSHSYSEDACLCLELKQLGYSVHEAGFEIVHTRGATSKRVPEALAAQVRNHEKAKVRFAHWLKHRTFSHRIIVRRWAATGDVLLITPILGALWEQYPLCTLHVETLFPELFDRNPHVTSAAKVLGRQPTDLVIDLDGTYEATPMRHIVRSYAQAAGVTVYDKFATRYTVSAEDARWARETWQAACPNNPGHSVAAVHVGLSTWPGKNWPLERWAELIGILKERECLVVLVGAQSNPSLTGLAALDLTGKTTIPQLFAVLQLCDFCVSIDSFPLHAAQAVGTPVVGLFGVTTPELICTDGSRWTAARSDKFHPDTGIRHRVAGATMVTTDSSCMETITVDAVLSAIDQLSRPAQLPIST